MTIDAVVFDIGRVLIDWQPEAFYDRRLGPEGRRALFAAVDLEGMNLTVDLGAELGPAVEALAARHPDWAEDIRCWHRDWLDMASPAIPGTARLLTALKARGVPVFALSNFGRETFGIACRAYPFLDLFDRRYVSAHLGLVKPDPAIYAALEADCGVAPDRLLFTDDKPENIAAAAARGWQTHLFDGAAGLAARLVAEGLLTEDEALADA